MNQQSQLQNDNIFDYAMPLLKIEKLERDIHDACNMKQYQKVGEMINELIVNARFVRAWANHHLNDVEIYEQGALCKAGNWSETSR